MKQHKSMLRMDQTDLIGNLVSYKEMQGAVICGGGNLKDGEAMVWFGPGKGCIQVNILDLKIQRHPLGWY